MKTLHLIALAVWIVMLIAVLGDKIDRKFAEQHEKLENIDLGIDDIIREIRYLDTNRGME